MIQVAILTQEQYDQVQGEFLTDSWKFNCALDANNNWTLDKNQIDNCTVETFQWLKQLPLVEWQRPVEQLYNSGSL